MQTDRPASLAADFIMHAASHNLICGQAGAFVPANYCAAHTTKALSISPSTLSSLFAPVFSFDRAVCRLLGRKNTYVSFKLLVEFEF